MINLKLTSLRLVELDLRVKNILSKGEARWELFLLLKDKLCATVDSSKENTVSEIMTDSFEIHERERK